MAPLENSHAAAHDWLSMGLVFFFFFFFLPLSFFFSSSY